MKKVTILSLVFVLISTAVSAQRPSNRYRRFNQITPLERFELRKDALRYKMAERRAHRDGFVTPPERRKLHKIKRHNRKDLFRFRHNNRRRVI